MTRCWNSFLRERSILAGTPILVVEQPGWSPHGRSLLCYSLLRVNELRQFFSSLLASLRRLFVAPG